MTSTEPRLHNAQKGAAVTVRVVPGSPEDKLTAVLKDGTLRVALRAEGETVNAALVKFLAQVFKVGEDKFEIVAGKRGVDKLISVLDVDPAMVQERVYAQLR